MAIQQETPVTGQSPQPPRVALRLLVVVALLVVAGGGLWLLTVATTPAPGPTAADIPALQVKPAPVQVGAAAPANVGSEPAAQASTTGQETAEAWLNRVAAASDIPARALRAYANADLTLRKVTPTCHLSWTMLAGIGRIESNHGRFGGAQLAADGTETKAIIGVPLDGSTGIENITDTDHGSLDGDPVHDRAVGPMQFLPGTWRNWASDGNGDGKADPQNIDDAAVTAGRYLCAGGRDLGTGQGWWAGVMSYNNSVEYGQKVFAVAEAAAKASTGR
ncbi:lytic murein transglycosylase [Kutzneria viridogrisea]|uniref:Membrane-bound lytic murein transglycosylase B n=1 Tax=Kutzneria viridogrisea TaxID=47990 RepID=A0ABR6BKT1_9PSEU|nr:membrane-bound lytic murein transglycosylase B [Kutzneria viridogrisea]